ncbi:hypothetical protein PC116_g30653 [Phytophthora cactorum]|nr:hypothetical protein PC116_g30653 [Phytophthora cactorum]
MSINKICNKVQMLAETINVACCKEFELESKPNGDNRTLKLDRNGLVLMQHGNGERVSLFCLPN